MIKNVIFRQKSLFHGCDNILIIETIKPKNTVFIAFRQTFRISNMVKYSLKNAFVLTHLTQPLKPPESPPVEMLEVNLTETNTEMLKKVERN